MKLVICLLKKNGTLAKNYFDSLNWNNIFYSSRFLQFSFGWHFESPYSSFVYMFFFLFFIAALVLSFSISNLLEIDLRFWDFIFLYDIYIFFLFLIVYLCSLTFKLCQLIHKLLPKWGKIIIIWNIILLAELSFDLLMSFLSISFFIDQGEANFAWLKQFVPFVIL